MGVQCSQQYIIKSAHLSQCLISHLKVDQKSRLIYDRLMSTLLTHVIGKKLTLLACACTNTCMYLSANTTKYGWVISTSNRLPQLQFCKLVSHACPNTAAIRTDSSCNIHLLLHIQSKNSFVIAYTVCNIHVLLHDCAR